ncbi:MAG: sugar phosphate isomerase/epimerase [Clostridia bacterium]|nr:sugar phosphate isomerase/epimerase [Clostridia bacterium]
MKISTEIGSASRIIGEEKAVEYVAKAGFDAWDFTLSPMLKYEWPSKIPSQTDHPLSGSNYLQFARKLKKIGEDNGIHCNQSHAPHPTGIHILDWLKRSVECTAEAGGKICIIHPANDLSAEENAEMYNLLLPFAKACGVKIATENMYGWNPEKDCASPAACCTPKDFNAHLDAVNDPDFVACLDLGHAEMRGINTSATEMIYALGDRLKTLHIHDNDRHKDSHQIPFSMDIDYTAIVKALKDINYQGYLTLEAYKYLTAYDAETAFRGIKNLADSAKKFSDMF